MSKLYKKTLAVALSAVVAISGAGVSVAAEETEYSITDLSGKYKTQGRTYLSEDALMLDWSSSGMIFTADCIGDVKITVDTSRISTAETQGIYFTVIVDGEVQHQDLRVPQIGHSYPFYITAKGESTFTIATDLEAGEHTFEIYKQSEALYSSFGIKSITLNGSFSEPPQEKELYIEVVGDSIAASYGNINGGSGNTALYQDSTRGWPYLTAQKLGADLSVIARTGITATKGIGYSGEDSVSMPDVYPLTRYFSDKTTAYDFKRQPDVIIVCLGTNDMASYKDIEGATTETVKQGFLDLIELLREKNPDSKIVWIYGMMTTAANSLINAAINESGGVRSGLYSLELPKEGSGNHPALENQYIYADEIAEFIDSNIINPDGSFPDGIDPDIITPSASVVYYNFNEGEGTAVNTKSTISSITSKMDYNATLSESAQWVQGFVGKAVKFDALSDTLSLNTVSGYNYDAIGMVPNTAKLSATGGSEYDFWVKFDEAPTEREQLIISRDSTKKFPWAIKVDTNGAINFGWSNTWYSGDALDWKTDEWYHINIQHLSDFTFTIKRDGSVVGSGSTVSSQTASGKVMYINGGIFSDSSNYFSGTIDELYLGGIGGGEEIRLRSKVTFSTNGGSYVEPQYPFYNNKATEIIPIKAGYIFSGWYTDAEYTEEFDFNSAVTADITLYAKWIELIFGDANGDSVVSTEDMSMLRQYLINILTSENINIDALDVYFDGIIDLKDLVRFKKYFAGIVDNLGSQNS